MCFAVRALAGDSVFDRLVREQELQRAEAPDRAAAIPDAPLPEQPSLVEPPLAKLLGATRRKAPLPERPEDVIQADAEVAIEETEPEVEDLSPYLDPRPTTPPEHVKPPVKIEVETEPIPEDPRKLGYLEGEEFGEAGLYPEEDLYEKPRLIDYLCELKTYLRRPMQGQSWLSRPMSAGLEFGGIWGGELIEGKVEQSSGVLFMGTFGWDHTDWDGYEVRVGGSTIDAFNLMPPLDPRNTRFSLFDFSVLLYPWGDARLRPFGRFGLGLHDYKFVDHEGRGLENIMAAGVIGVGAKYLFSRHIALRMEFVDNIGWGDGVGLGTIHNTALTFGAEYRFGGQHKMYWPWNSGRLFW